MNTDTDNGSDSHELGSYVQRLRQEQGKSVRGLAAAAQVDATWLSRLEHGTYGSPDAKALYRLARALDIEVADLYLAAGYGDGRGLPGFAPYLRAKYDLPTEAVAQLEAHFDLINKNYGESREGGPHARDQRHYRRT